MTLAKKLDCKLDSINWVILSFLREKSTSASSIDRSTRSFPIKISCIFLIYHKAKYLYSTFFVSWQRRLSLQAARWINWFSLPKKKGKPLLPSPKGSLCLQPSCGNAKKVTFPRHLSRTSAQRHPAALLLPNYTFPWLWLAVPCWLPAYLSNLSLIKTAELAVLAERHNTARPCVECNRSAAAGRFDPSLCWLTLSRRTDCSSLSLSLWVTAQPNANVFSLYPHQPIDS